MKPPKNSTTLTIHRHPEVDDPEWIAAVTACALDGQKKLAARPESPYLLLNATQLLILQTILSKTQAPEQLPIPLPTAVIHQLRELGETELTRKIRYNPTGTMFALTDETAGWSDKKIWLIATWGFSFDWPNLEAMAKQLWLRNVKAELLKIQGFMKMDLETIDSLVDEVFAEGRGWEPAYSSLVRR